MSITTHIKNDTESLEIQLLFEGVFQRYGYDFRNYSHESMKRGVSNIVRAEKLESVSAFQGKVLRDPDCMARLMKELTINVTEMFRDPDFYLAFREKVVPLLRTYPFVRIWHAGCSTGEEVYSMAILLREEGLYNKCKVYATDINEAALKNANSGIFPLKTMQLNTANYISAGGKHSFSDYYSANYGSAIFNASLKKNVVFSHHNLVTDGSFNEFNVVICRNVMIYFDNHLHARVHNLIYESLCKFGILALGNMESLQFSVHESRYETLAGSEKIYRKVA